jgi:hypothetical protein
MLRKTWKINEFHEKSEKELIIYKVLFDEFFYNYG